MIDAYTNDRLKSLEKNLNEARRDIADLKTLISKLVQVDENNMGIVDRILNRLEALEAESKRWADVERGLKAIPQAIEAAATEEVQYKCGPQRFEIARALEFVSTYIGRLL